jgi:aminopeptidase N
MATNLPLFLDDFIDEQDIRETITIQVAQPLRPNRDYKVSMKFISFLNDELRGFYRSSYVEDGVTKYV